MKQKHKIIIKDIKELKDAMNHPADYELDEDLQRRKTSKTSRVQETIKKRRKTNASE